MEKKAYNAPLETLRRANGSVPMGWKPGPSTIVTDEEKDIYVSTNSRYELYSIRDNVHKCIALSLYKTRHPFGDGKAGVKACHPQITICTPQSLSFCRAVSANEYDFIAKLDAIYGRLNLSRSQYSS